MRSLRRDGGDAISICLEDLVDGWPLPWQLTPFSRVRWTCRDGGAVDVAFASARSRAFVEARLRGEYLRAQVMLREAMPPIWVYFDAHRFGALAHDPRGRFAPWHASP
jgi:hypothetical protein